MKKALIIGNGGRESAIAYKLHKEGVEIYAYPVNPGMDFYSNHTTIINDDFSSIKDFIIQNKIDLTVIGPEKYLNDGIVDYLSSFKIKVFGPSRESARIETEKAFAKKLMKSLNIPTAGYKIAASQNECVNIVNGMNFPYVIKVSGLAAGKGAFVIKNDEDKVNALKSIYEDKLFNDAGNMIVVEDFLIGEEASLFIISDGRNFLPFTPAQDYKRAYDDDKGLNTGGMGSYAPCRLIDEKRMGYVIDRIIEPILNGLRNDDKPYKGILYAGLMINEDEINVVEFNARFGDPETQSILPLMDEPLYELMYSACEGNIKRDAIRFKNESAVSVVVAANGYPENYEKGMDVEIDYNCIDGNTIIFHAGTQYSDGRLVSSGGRILNATSIDDTLSKAIERVYKNLECVKIENTFYRKDIGRRGLKYE